MMRGLVALVVSVLVVLPSLAVRADEEKVALDKLPKAVVAAVKKKFPGAKLVSAEKEKKDKQILFEVRIKDGEQNVEVTLTPEGKIVEIEKEITTQNLPKGVLA